MLRGLDPAKDNLADNEEIQVCTDLPCFRIDHDTLQELYRSSMSLRPKIVKLIDKYSQKRGMRHNDECLAFHFVYKLATSAELVAMNENFVKARGVFEQMMEDSLARHTGGMHVYHAPISMFNHVSKYMIMLNQPSEKLDPSHVLTLRRITMRPHTDGMRPSTNNRVTMRIQRHPLHMAESKLNPPINLPTKVSPMPTPMHTVEYLQRVPMVAKYPRGLNRIPQ
jgi:hypothetical protein